MPVIRVDDNRLHDIWVMPDGFPDSLDDVQAFDVQGVQRLAEEIYKGAYRDLCSAYSKMKRKIWRLYPEVYSEGFCKKNILQCEAWFFENSFSLAFKNLDPRYFIKQARLEVFGPKWRDYPYFMRRKRENEKKRQKPKKPTT